MSETNKISEQLKQPLDVTRVKKRQGGGGTSLSYIETHDAIASLNRIFGYDGWSFELLDFAEQKTAKGFLYRQAVSLSVRFDGLSVTRQDVGIGIASNVNPDQIEKGMKEAASDALKRCARTLGEQFGNSLYEKDAPEHRGEQRARLAAAEQLAECEALRIKAVQLGFRAKSGEAPKKQEEGAEEKPVLARIEAYRKFVQENGDKGQGVPPEPVRHNADRIEKLRLLLASNDAFEDFENEARSAGMVFDFDRDIQSFELAAAKNIGIEIVAENLIDTDWSEFAVAIRNGELRWPS